MLIDAGFICEAIRTTAGCHCLRLTHAGHEFIELARSERRWREAKWVVQQRTGGLSLAVIQEVLTKWSVDSSLYSSSFDPKGYYRSGQLHQITPHYTEAPPEAQPEYLPRPLPESPYLERFYWQQPTEWREQAERQRLEAIREAFQHDRLAEEWSRKQPQGPSLPNHVV